MIPSEIIEHTASAFLTTPTALVAPGGCRNVRQARAAVVFVLREHRQTSKLTFDHLAQKIGRPRKTAWYWWLKALELRKRNGRFRLLTDALLAIAVLPVRQPA